MTEEEFEKAMLHGERKIPFFTLLKRTLSYAKGDMWRIVLSLFVVTIGVVVDLLLPIIEKWFVDYLDAEHIQNAVLSVIIGAAIGFIAIALVNKIISYLMSLLLQKAGQNIVERLRVDVFSHIENMSQNQLNEMPVGSLVTRVANYTAAVSNLFTDVLVRFVMNMLTVLTVFVIMITLSWKLSLILLVFAVIVGVVSFFFVGVVASKYRAERKNTSILNSFLSENLQGMKIISIFNQQKKKQAQFDEDNENLRKSAYGINVAFTFYRPFMSFLYYGAIATTFGVGFALAFTPGLIVAFYLYLNRFFKPIQELADELNKIQSALTSSERLFNLLDVKPEVVDAEDAIEIDSFKGKIEFRNVWFAYEKDNWILRDVSFTVNHDIDIAHIKVKSLRKAVGQMLQDVFLFSGTIKSNVSLRDESFDDKEIKEACEYVNASSFIEKLPKGYDEDVIEGGANFSSGQRQLLSFARTVLHKPQILILDEATANIDTETEMLIQSSLEKMKNIGTMLVVAHRLSTIQHADNIIVLQNGQIIEEGNHQSLLKKRGYYFKLYQLQFEH